MTLASVSKLAKWIMILSLIPVLLGAFLVIRTHFSLLHAVAVTGTIIELVEERANNNGNFEIYYRPVLSFKDTKGETHKTRSASYFLSNRVKIGDKCDFLYDPENFSTVEDQTFPGIFLIGFGFLHFLFFLIVMLITRKMLKSTGNSNVLQTNMTAMPTNTKSWNRLSKIMMTISGIAMFFAVVLTVHTIIFLLYAVPAIGTIVAVEQKEDMDSRIISYIPVFTFQDAKGVTYKVSSPTETTFTPVVGEKIDILYNPMNPNHARENGFFGLWGQAINYVIGAFIFWLAAFIIKRRIESKTKTLR
ncbi:MAG: DUF3592 domain-containing protein [Lentisphaerota bacterium]